MRVAARATTAELRALLNMMLDYMLLVVLSSVGMEAEERSR
jgi:hypothetical protein